MKKLSIWLIAVALLLTVCACGQPTVEEPTTLPTTEPTQQTEAIPTVMKVGYARVDITPRITTPLRGFGSTSARMSNSILEPVYASCVAVTGGNEKTLLMIAIDNCSSEFSGKVLPLISEKTGVPEEYIYINASHTHAATDLSNAGEAFYFDYIKELQALLPELAMQALLDRSPAEMSFGSIETENLNFTRHYKYISTGGNLTYSFGGVDAISNSGFSEHITEPDETMHVIQFVREEGKDIVMTNWRAHPLLHSGEGRLELSSDFVGPFRTAVELTQDCHFIYFQGASGNMNSITAIPSEIRTEDANEYGAILAAYVSECLENNMQKAEDNEIKYTSSDNTNAVIPKLNAFSIGNSVGFVTAPNELFDAITVYTEENSPYAMTFALGYTNGGKGYVPMSHLYDYLPDYEWYEIGVTPYPQGTAERVQEEFVRMLNVLSTAPVELGSEDELTLAPVESHVVSTDLYWNVYRWDYTPGGSLDHSSRTKEDDGYYHVVFAADGKQETLLVKEKSLIEIIDYNDITGLVLDSEGVVIDVKVLRDCTGGMAANRAIVTGVEGNTVSLTTGAVNGVAFTLTLSDDTGIYDVSTADELCGAETQLQEGDQIIAVQDLDGKIIGVFVIRRAHVDDLTHENHCVCGGAAEGLHGECAAVTDWIAWGDDPEEWETLPTKTGYYYLTRDVTLRKLHKSPAGEDITICLNGKKVSAHQSKMISVLGGLSICDCRFTCENGTYTYEGALLSTYSDESTLGGVVYVNQYGNLNIYSGRVDSTGYWKRGGLIYTSSYSVTNLYNPYLDGTDVLAEGGVVYINNGEVNIFGGVITGGNASLKGSGIYMKNGTLTISGAPKIAGNTRTDLCLASGKKIVIGEGGLKKGAEIGITLDAGNGVFAANASKSDAQYFTAKDMTVSWNSQTNELSIATAAG